MESIFEYRRAEAEKIIAAAEMKSKRDPEQTRILVYRHRGANDHSPILEAYVAVPQRKYAIKLSAVNMSDRKMGTLEERKNRTYATRRPVSFGDNDKLRYEACSFMLDGVMSTYKAASSVGNPDPNAWKEVEIVVRRTKDSESYLKLGDLYDFLRFFAEKGISRNLELIIHKHNLTHK